MRFSRLYAIIILLLITLTLSSNEKIITLEEAKSLALEHNNLIKGSKEKVRASTQTKKSLFTNYLPKLEVTANYLLRSEATEMTLEGGYLPTYNFNPNTNELEANLLINPQTNQPVFGDDGLPIFNQYALFPDKDLKILPKSGFTSGISLKQALFTGGKVTSAYKMASLGQEASLLQLDYTRENVLFTTEEAYWRLVSLNQKTKVTRTYLNLIQNVLAKVQDSYDVGMINKNQLLQAKVKYNEVSLLNQEAQNGLELATMALAQQIGLPLSYDLVPADSLTHLPLNLELATFSSQDYLQRYDYQMLKIKQEVAEWNIKLKRADFLPQIGLLASYNYLSYQLNDQNHDDFSANAMAHFSLPIFQWGDSFYQVNEAKAKHKEESFHLENSKELMKLQINQSLTEVENKEAKLTLAQSALTQANEYLKLESDNYDVGMTTLTDLLNAQSQWQKSYSDYIDAQLEVNIAFRLLEKRCGRYSEIKR